MKPSSAGLAVFGAMLLCIAVPGHARSDASVTLSDFRITLLDLDAADGVAPTIAFEPGSRSTAQTGAVSPGASEFWSHQGSSSFAPVSASGQMDGIGGTASFAGDPLGAGATLATHAVAIPGYAGGSGEDYVQNQFGDTRFTLSAHTQATFAGIAAVDWRASAPGAEAEGDVALRFWQWVDGNFVTYADDEFAAGWQQGGAAALSGSASRPVSIAFANTTGASVVLNYDLLVNAWADEERLLVTSVDEPAAAWLLLLGTLPLARAARRRRLD